MISPEINQSDDQENSVGELQQQWDKAFNPEPKVSEESLTWQENFSGRGAEK